MLEDSTLSSGPGHRPPGPKGKIDECLEGAPRPLASLAENEEGDSARCVLRRPPHSGANRLHDWAADVCLPNTVQKADANLHLVAAVSDVRLASMDSESATRGLRLFEVKAWRYDWYPPSLKSLRETQLTAQVAQQSAAAAQCGREYGLLVSSPRLEAFVDQSPLIGGTYVETYHPNGWVYPP